MKFKLRMTQAIRVGLIMLCLFEITTAQVVNPTPPATEKTVVFKGKSGKLPNADEIKANRQRKLPLLSLTEKRNLLRRVMVENGVTNPPSGTSTYVSLDVRTTSVANKGNLLFLRPLRISGSGNYATFPGADNQQVYVNVKPARAGQWLLIDCIIDAAVPGDPFKIEGTGESVIETTVRHEGHLQAFLISEDTEWLWIKFYWNRGAWDFISCEVTTPD